MTKPFSYKRYLQAAILGSCLFILGCENDIKKINDWSKKVDNVEEAKNINTLFSQSGTVKAHLTSPLMLRYVSDTTLMIFPNTLHVDFYDSLARKESFLDAKYAKYMENRGMVLLKDSVRVINIQGDTLSTQELWWDQNQKKFYTDSVVKILQRDKHIRGGRGLEASQDLTWYVIKNPVGTVLVGSSVLPQ